MNTDRIRILTEVIEITYKGMITQLVRMKNEEEMMKNEIMAISGVNYKKLDAICERIKQYSTVHILIMQSNLRCSHLQCDSYIESYLQCLHRHKTDR